MDSSNRGNVITLAEAAAMFSSLPTDLESEVKIPYIMEHQRLMKSGVWNGMKYSNQVLEDAFLLTEWTDQHNRALWLDHTNTREGTSDPSTYIGEVRNIEWLGGELYGDVVIVDKPIAMKIHYGAKIGYSPEFSGDDLGGVAEWLRYKGFALVLNPAVTGNWVRSEHGYYNSKIVNVNYNKQNEVKTLSENTPETLPDKKFEDLKVIFDTFTAKYKEEHPDAKDFEIMTELNKVVKEAIADSPAEEPESTEEPAPQEETTEEPKPDPDPKPEPATNTESPPVDKESRDKIKALESKLSAMERLVEKVNKKVIEVPDKKSVPAEGGTPAEQMDVDKMMTDWLQKNFKEYEVN